MVAPEASDVSRFTMAESALHEASFIRRVARRSIGLVPELYDRATLAAFGVVLNAVSGYQVARDHIGGLPNLGQEDGNWLQQILYDSGQHFGPSLVVGLTGASLLRACDEKALAQGRMPEADIRHMRGPRRAIRYASTAFLAAGFANCANELCEGSTGRNLVAKTVTESFFSFEDLAVGTATPVAVLALAAAAQVVRNTWQTRTRLTVVR